MYGDVVMGVHHKCAPPPPPLPTTSSDPPAFVWARRAEALCCGGSLLMVAGGADGRYFEEALEKLKEDKVSEPPPLSQPRATLEPSLGARHSGTPPRR